MTLRHLAGPAAALALVFSGPAPAQDWNGAWNDYSEMKQLQVMLAAINSELKSDLDQILVLQEAIKANARPPLEAQGRSPDPVSFDAMADAQRLAIQRESVLNARLDELIARSAELDAAKRPILDRMREISFVTRR